MFASTKALSERTIHAEGLVLLWALNFAMQARVAQENSVELAEHAETGPEWYIPQVPHSAQVACGGAHVNMSRILA